MRQLTCTFACRCIWRKWRECRPRWTCRAASAGSRPGRKTPSPVYPSPSSVSDCRNLAQSIIIVLLQPLNLVYFPFLLLFLLHVNLISLSLPPSSLSLSLSLLLVLSSFFLSLFFFSLLLYFFLFRSVQSIRSGVKVMILVLGYPLQPEKWNVSNNSTYLYFILLNCVSRRSIWLGVSTKRRLPFHWLEFPITGRNSPGKWILHCGGSEMDLIDLNRWWRSMTLGFDSIQSFTPGWRRSSRFLDEFNTLRYVGALSRISTDAIDLNLIFFKKSIYTMQQKKQTCNFNRH